MCLLRKGRSGLEDSGRLRHQGVDISWLVGEKHGVALLANVSIHGDVLPVKEVKEGQQQW